MQDLKIVADYREKNSLVISELIEKGIKIEFKNLLVGDFIVRGIAIERKTISDFLSSMINKRLIRQLQELQQYKSRLLIIEGIEEQEIYNDKKEGIHGNAVRGFLLDILLKYKVPIILTKDYEDTSTFLYLLAKKSEQEAGIRAKKKALTKKEQLQYILEGFPSIGPKTAKKLLKKYKTLSNIFSQNIDELKKEVGKKAGIFKLLDERY